MQQAPRTRFFWSQVFWPRTLWLKPLALVPWLSDDACHCGGLGCLYRRAFAITLSVVLGGCGLARQYQEREQAEQLKAQAKVAVAECNVKFPVGNAKIEVARAQCLNDALAIQMPVLAPDQDLVQLFMADRMAIAEQIQNGKIELVEGNAEIAAKWSAVVSESQRRQMANRPKLLLLVWQQSMRPILGRHRPRLSFNSRAQFACRLSAIGSAI